MRIVAIWVKHKLDTMNVDFSRCYDLTVIIIIIITSIMLLAIFEITLLVLNARLMNDDGLSG
jgi:hypothetical protein